MKTIDTTPQGARSKSISDDIQAFLEQGGRVETIPAGASSKPLKAFTFGHRELSEQSWESRGRTIRAATPVLPARR